MKIMVVYDSFFGNTKQVAVAMGEVLKQSHDCNVLHVGQCSVDELEKSELIIIGSPTRGFEPTKPIVNLMKTIIGSSRITAAVATFDTRMDVKAVNNFVLTFLEKRRGNAGTTFKKMAERTGRKLLVEPEGFIVLESEGPMKDGEIDRAGEWAKSLVTLV